MSYKEQFFKKRYVMIDFILQENDIGSNLDFGLQLGKISGRDLLGYCVSER